LCGRWAFVPVRVEHHSFAKIPESRSPSNISETWIGGLSEQFFVVFVSDNSSVSAQLIADRISNLTLFSKFINVSQSQILAEFNDSTGNFTEMKFEFRSNDFTSNDFRDKMWSLLKAGAFVDIWGSLGLARDCKFQGAFVLRTRLAGRIVQCV
jgi:hypothetical protein